MNDAIEEYLSALKVPKPIAERVSKAFGAFEFLCERTPSEQPEATVDRVFLCDGVNDAGDKSFLSCWGFSDTYWFEARNFLTTENADISAYAGSIWYLGMDYRDLTPGEPCVESSLLTVDVATGRLDSNTLSATGMNCNYLLGIVSDLFLPNVKSILA